MHNKDKVIFDKKLPYEYNICLYILEELCDKGVIDVFEMTEAIILRKKYKMPVIDIYDKKDSVSTTSKRHYQGTCSGVIAHNKRSTTTINRANNWLASSLTLSICVNYIYKSS